jgi:hypothetical protein
VHFLWQGETAQYGAQNALANAYMQMQEKKAADLKAAYQADTYGGATPEETLRLFVEALEKKDYVLASRYFVVEEQSPNLQRSEDGANSGGFAALVDAYKKGKIDVTKSADGKNAEINVYPSGETTGFFFRARINEFSSKWKLTDN